MTPERVLALARFLLVLVLLLSLWMFYEFVNIFITIGIYPNGPYPLWRLLEPISFFGVGVWGLLWLRRS